MEAKFINHACIEVSSEKVKILFDPWFEKSVFNHSWDLLKESEISELELDDVTHIVISHEHPDHLNWPTLKLIQEKSKNENSIDVIMFQRNDDNVANELKKIGFNPVFLPVGDFVMAPDHQNEEDFTICFFRKGHDSAIYLELDNKSLLNINDCEFDKNELNIIKKTNLENRKNITKIDYMFRQFSLAGYYGNKDNSTVLQKSKNKHINDFLNSIEAIKPKVAVPFASYIYFSRKENDFLNNYIVSPLELLAFNKKQNIFVPFMNEIVPLRKNSKRSVKNAHKWDSLINKHTKTEKNAAPIISEEHLKTAFHNFMNLCNMHKNYYYKPIPNHIFTLNIDDTKSCKFNFWDGQISFFNKKDSDAAADVSSYDLKFFFDFLWGADTLNITSCFTIHDTYTWTTLLKFKDSFYVK